MIDNALLESDKLSWRAKGILCYLLSRPDSWSGSVKDLAKHSTKVGKDAITSSLKELEKAGYLTRSPIRDPKSQKMCGWQYDVYEKPLAEKPLSEKPTSENPQAYNTSVPKTVSEKKNVSEKKDSDSSASLQNTLKQDHDSLETGEATPKADSVPSLPLREPPEGNALRPPKFDQRRTIPTREEFDAFVDAECPNVAKRNPYLYDRLERKKWRDRILQPVTHWQEYVMGVENDMEKKKQK